MMEQIDNRMNGETIRTVMNRSFCSMNCSLSACAYTVYFIYCF